MEHSLPEDHRRASANWNGPAVCAPPVRPAAIRLWLVAFAVAFAIAPPEIAHTGPKKALGDYSQVCQDEHLRCLNQCQKDYSRDADIRACFGVCDDWLDDACDKTFPKARVKLPESVRPPASGGVLEPYTGPTLHVPKVAPEGAIGQ